MSNPVYHWHIELMVDCPMCGERFDFTNTDAWSEQLGKTYEICSPFKNAGVACPECEHEFKFDIGSGL